MEKGPAKAFEFPYLSTERKDTMVGGSDCVYLIAATDALLSDEEGIERKEPWILMLKKFKKSIVRRGSAAALALAMLLPTTQSLARADFTQDNVDEVVAQLESRNTAVHVFDTWMRDPYITLHGDYYYLTCTQLLGDGTNSSFPVYRSTDLAHWEELGKPYSFKTSSWWEEVSAAKPDDTAGNNARLWAPEIHYIAELGQWVLVHTTSFQVSNFVTCSKGFDFGDPSTWEGAEFSDWGTSFGKQHDPSIFYDDATGKYYLVSFHTNIQELKPDMSGFAEGSQPITIKPTPSESGDILGYEGCHIKKIGDKYVLFGTCWSQYGGEDGTTRGRGTYNLYYCTADNIEGPYSERRFAGRGLGHGTMFQDKDGQWWCTAFRDGTYMDPEKIYLEGVPEIEEGTAAQISLNQSGLTLVPMDVTIDETGDVFVRALDPYYENPGWEETFTFPDNPVNEEPNRGGTEDTFVPEEKQGYAVAKFYDDKTLGDYVETDYLSADNLVSTYSVTDTAISSDSKLNSIATQKMGDAKEYSMEISFYVEPKYQETYTLHTVGCMSYDLYVDGEKKISGLTPDRPTNQEIGTVRDTQVDFTAEGRHEIVVRLNQRSLNTFFNIQWESASQTREPIPADCIYTTKGNDAQSGQFIRADSYAKLLANTKANNEGDIAADGTVVGGMDLTGVQPLHGIMDDSYGADLSKAAGALYKGVEFGDTGVQKLGIVHSGYKPFNVDIILDDMNNPPVATVKIPKNSGSWNQKFLYTEFSIPTLTGTHDVYFRVWADNNTKNLANIYGFQFFAGDPVVAATGVTVDGERTNMEVNETLVLTASVSPDNATNQEVYWHSKNPEIASVSRAGMVTGVAEGTTEIYADIQGHRAAYSVTVGTASPAEPADKTLLEDTIAYAEEQKASPAFQDVIAMVQDSFNTALDHAKAVLADEQATQEEVNEAWSALVTECHKLSMVKGDITSLELLVQMAESCDLSKYVEEGQAEFLAALADAQELLADRDNAMAQEIGQAEDALLDALLNLRFKADKSILEELMAEAEGKDAAAYTPESYAVLTCAVQQAKAVMSNENATQEEVDAAVDGVRVAMAQLVAAEPAPTVEPTAEPTAQPTSQPSAQPTVQPTDKPDVPQTGDSSNLTIWFMVMLGGVAACVGLVLYNKRRHHAH